MEYQLLEEKKNIKDAISHIKDGRERVNPGNRTIIELYRSLFSHIKNVSIYIEIDRKREEVYNLIIYQVDRRTR